MNPEADAWTPTDAQSELIYADGSRLVEACPGAGKTRAIVARYRRVGSEAGRRGVGLLSFTNAAIDEVRRRCEDPHVLQAPNFVGTFDTFINRFITGPEMATALRRFPRFVESWRSLPAASFSAGNLARGIEFSLDQFDWDNEEAYRFVPTRAVGPYGNALRKAYDEAPLEIDAAARKARDFLVNKQVIVPCSESRRIARRVLENTERAKRAAFVLRRFKELIVDEAQDCGPEELAVLRSALAAGVRVVAVADLDQAIFEFRRAMPEAVSEFADEIGRGTRLSGNFRSSPAIVRVGERLRASHATDEALGPEATNQSQVSVIAFDRPTEVAGALREQLDLVGIDRSRAVVLAHRGDHAAACAGAPDALLGLSGRSIIVIADAALSIRTADDPARRRQALTAVERVLLRAAGARSGRTVDEDAEALGLSSRWIRDAATRVVFGADPRANDRSDFTRAVRDIVQSLTWPAGVVISNQALATPPEAAWLALGVDTSAEPAPFSWMTVHAAKGREFDAVALIIPQALRPDDTGLTCIDHWEQGSDAESRRVLYVGATRARKFLMIAVHQDHYERVSALLQAESA